MSGKLDYSIEKAPNKHLTREFLFSFFDFKTKLTNIYGLGGPTINDCIEFYNSQQVNNIEIWENDESTYSQQLQILEHPIKLNFGNILSVDGDKEDVLYDLDYCCTIKTIKQEDIAKFKKNFIMTFSLRGGYVHTIEKFLNARNEHLKQMIEKHSPIFHKIFYTENGIYIYTPYHDTSAMCCIAKIQ